ncbi:MAG: ATP-binding protein [Gemmatimonadota bacterium]
MSANQAGLRLGEVVDPETGDRTGTPVILPTHHLTTHGVIVGMTGSGKTGLGVVMLEEALLAGVPVLVLDPKGDMGNLLLTFPELEPGDFRPWIDPAEARRKGVDLDEHARDVAEEWRTGLASWDIGPARIRRLRDSAAFTVYTPGSGAGVPLNLLGALTAPAADDAGDPEAVRDEIEGFVSGLLAIAGIDADPLSSPEHILLSSVIEHEWDAFYPEKERRKLAVRLNGLLASPAFESWMDGRPLDLDTLLRTPDGRPGAAIVYLAHLSEAERQFVVTLILTRLIAWMRRQPGTSDLRVLVYMDEMFGFAPPTAQPPSKKPILTIFKQGRAHGVGMVVSTQNPVDLDYKVISNAGTWMLGRLQTERDKARVLEGLRSASGAVDLPAVDDLLSGLRKREFVLRTTRSPEPAVFTTRWAMSYLRGALTREEVRRLMAGADPTPERTAVGADAGSPAGPGVTASGAGSAPPPGEAPVADDETPLAPAVPDSVPGPLPGSGRTLGRGAAGRTDVDPAGARPRRPAPAPVR